MSFLNANKRFLTIEAFRAYLATLPRPDFVPIGLTYHNTYRPDEAGWAGSASMRSMQRTYEQKVPAWDRGPHLYLAHGTRYDGIFVMTPPNHYGVHAGPCNGGPGTRGRFGIEMVHDGDRSPFSAAQVQLLAQAGAALLAYARVTTPDLVAHRDCMPGRTCPGRYAYDQKPQIIAALAAAMQAPPPTPPEPAPAGQLVYRVRPGATALVREAPEVPPRDRPDNIALKGTARLGAGTIVHGDEIKHAQMVRGDDRWLHMANGWGFIHLSALEPA